MKLVLLVVFAAIVAVHAVVPIKPMHVIPVREVSPAVEPVEPVAPSVPSNEPIGRQFTGSALPKCDADRITNVTDASGTTGCTDVVGGKYLTWNFGSDTGHSFRVSISGYQGSWIAVYFGGRGVYTYYPGNEGTFTFPDGYATSFVYYTGSYTSSGYGVSITYSEAPKAYHLVSGHTFNLEKQQQGGFVYFALPYYGLGELFYLEVNVYSYQGLQEPGVFVSTSNFPTLEKYDYTNNTVSQGDKEQMILYQYNPRAGVYIVGVFLYGSAARIGVTATWSFNINILTSGVKVQAQTKDIVYYQATVPVNTKQLRFQISRQVPGGYPIAYIAQGTLASDTNYEYKADTTSQSYISITIPDPNPVTNPQPNPGNYIIGVAASTTSGFIIQCDW